MLLGGDDVVLDWFTDGGVYAVAASTSEDATGILEAVIFVGLGGRGIGVLMGGDDVVLGWFADSEAKVVAVSTSEHGTGILKGFIFAGLERSGER